jgi:hypothetical protein
MKAFRFFAAVVGMVAACALRADTGGQAPRTEVIFDHPEKFTDIKDSDVPTDKGENALLAQFRDFLVRKTASMLPEGYHLTVTFTDIDLAGDFEPWHGPQYDQIRIVKEIYPPAFKFTYAVTDPTGRVVKQGTENIRDVNFQMRITLDSSDPLRYEKDILSDWARGALRDLKKA